MRDFINTMFLTGTATFLFCALWAAVVGPLDWLRLVVAAAIYAAMGVVVVFMTWESK